MMDDKKEYLIKIFITKCTSTNRVMGEHLKFLIRLLQETYHLPENRLSEMRKKYSLEAYTKKLIPIISKQLSVDELKEAVKFYSSGVGKKIIDPSFLLSIDKLSQNMVAQMEQEFASPFQ